MASAILFRDMPALRTDARAISRVHQDHCDPSPLGFVRDKIPKLSETPRILLVPLLFSNRHPGSDVRQVFEHNRGFRVFGVLNKLFRYAVVDPATKTRLFFREFFQTPLGRPRVGLLEGCLVGGATQSGVLDVIARELVAVGVRCDLDNTEVHAQKAFGLNWGSVRNFHRAVEVKLTTLVEKVALPLQSRPIPVEVVAHQDRDQNAAIEGENRHLFETFETHQTLVEDHRAGISKRRASLTVTSKALDGFAYSSHGHLGGQAISASEIEVAPSMDRLLVVHTVLEPNLGGVSRSLVEGGHGTQKLSTLLGCRQQLDLLSEFHADSLGQHLSVLKKVLALTGNFVSSPLTEGVSTKEF